VFSLNSCPVCHQQMEFFGISAVKQEAFEVDDFGDVVLDDRGNPIRVTVRNRWTHCDTCNGYFEHDDTGKTISVRTVGWTKDELKRLFPTTNEHKAKVHASPQES
jgi:sarcosine oxidase delta subunit